jgi:CheY-like chemotaxis protein
MSNSPDFPVSDEFIEHVKQALENLYDFPYLQRHPLAEAHKRANAPSDEPIGHALRRELIAAIDALNPGESVSVRSGASRLFNLMHLHYVGGMTLQESAFELGISARQAYRDLRRGLESVSAMLWHARNSAPAPVPSAPAPPAQASIQAEVAWLESENKPVNLAWLLSQAVRAVEKLAQRHNVVLQVAPSHDLATVHTHQAVAQQTLISLLSQAIQQGGEGVLSVALANAENGVRLSLSASLSFNEVLLGLMREVGWRYSDAGGALEVLIPSHGRTLLIIDDNEGFTQLLERYLTASEYRVLCAKSGAEGLQLARLFKPKAIIMDLMMPEMDGWELLQRLRLMEDTAQTPVVICSVINDPELAYSLGATLFLSKPISQDTLFSALKQVGI